MDRSITTLTTHRQVADRSIPITSPADVVVYQQGLLSSHQFRLNQCEGGVGIFLCKGFTLCCSRKYPYHPPPHPPLKATEIPRGGESNRRQFPRRWGVTYRGFFPRGVWVRLMTEWVINNNNNSFSVEQAISYFTVTGASKQVLLFSLIIFYHGLRVSFL